MQQLRLDLHIHIATRKLVLVNDKDHSLVYYEKKEKKKRSYFLNWHSPLDS